MHDSIEQQTNLPARRIAGLPIKGEHKLPPWLADPRAQVVATLACAIVPFRFEELVCVSCQGLCYESDAKQRCFAEARERTQRDGFLDEDFRGRAPDAARKVGRCVKHPFQGAVVLVAERPERTIADFKCFSAPHVVRRRAPRRKTFVASVLALARELTY